MKLNNQGSLQNDAVGVRVDNDTFTMQERYLQNMQAWFNEDFVPGDNG